MKMKLLLLICSMVQYCTSQGQITAAEEELDMSKLSGQWYPFLLASTFKSWEMRKNYFGAFIYKIEVNIDKVIIIFYTRDRDTCIRFPMICYRIGPNRFKFKFTGRHEFHVEDVDPDDYLLLSTHNEFDEKFLGVELYSRRQEGTLNRIIRNKFVQMYKSYGIKNDSCIDLTTTDRCLKYWGNWHRPAG